METRPAAACLGLSADHTCARQTSPSSHSPPPAGNRLHLMTLQQLWHPALLYHTRPQGLRGQDSAWVFAGPRRELLWWGGVRERKQLLGSCEVGIIITYEWRLQLVLVSMVTQLLHLMKPDSNQSTPKIWAIRDQEKEMELQVRGLKTFDVIKWIFWWTKGFTAKLWCRSFLLWKDFFLIIKVAYIHL